MQFNAIYTQYVKTNEKKETIWIVIIEEVVSSYS